MEQIILGILAGVAINVVEANGQYVNWMRGDTIPPVVYVPIRHVVEARAFLDDLEEHAKLNGKVPCDICGEPTNFVSADLPIGGGYLVCCKRCMPNPID